MSYCYTPLKAGIGSELVIDHLGRCKDSFNFVLCFHHVLRIILANHRRPDFASFVHYVTVEGGDEGTHILTLEEEEQELDDYCNFERNIVWLRYMILHYRNECKNPKECVCCCIFRMTLHNILPALNEIEKTVIEVIFRAKERFIECGEHTGPPILVPVAKIMAEDKFVALRSVELKLDAYLRIIEECKMGPTILELSKNKNRNVAVSQLKNRAELLMAKFEVFKVACVSEAFALEGDVSAACDKNRKLLSAMILPDSNIRPLSVCDKGLEQEIKELQGEKKRLEREQKKTAERDERTKRRIIELQTELKDWKEEVASIKACVNEEVTGLKACNLRQTASYENLLALMHVTKTELEAKVKTLQNKNREQTEIIASFEMMFKVSAEILPGLHEVFPYPRWCQSRTSDPQSILHTFGLHLPKSVD